jgi:hypothetical protein
MLSQTNINQSENILKSNRIRLSMDMDLAAKLNLAGVAMSRRRKLEATNLLNEEKIRQARHVERTITMMKGQMKI